MGRTEKTISEDGLHPNKLGAELIAETVGKVLYNGVKMLKDEIEKYEKLGYQV